MSGLPPDTSAEVVRLARDCPLLLARRLRVGGSVDLSIGTSPTRFAHGLGRRPEGYLVTQLNQAATIFRIDESTVSPPVDGGKEIVLRASTVGTIARILIF